MQAGQTEVKKEFTIYITNLISQFLALRQSIGELIGNYREDSVKV